MIKLLRLILPEFQIIHFFLRSSFEKMDGIEEKKDFTVQKEDDREDPKVEKKSQKKGRVIDV